MNAKKLLSTLLSAAMAVSMLAGCFGGGGNKNYSDEAADAANAAQNTVVFSTDATLAKSLQDALADGLTQLDEIDDAMEADENLKPLLTSGWDLDIFAAQGEDAEAAAKTIAEQYIVSAVIGKKAEGKIAMVLHDGNGYYYVAVLTYGSGGSSSGGGAGGGSGSGDDGNRPGPGDDDDEENGVYDVDAKALDGNGTVKADKATVKAGETVTITVTPKDGGTLEMIPADMMTFTVTPDDGWKIAEVSGANVTSNGNGSYTLSNVTENTTVTVTFEEIVYKVSPNRILNGRVVVNPSVVYPSRGEDSVTITLHPNDGYELGNIEDIKVSVGTVAPTGTDNQYIWSGITEDATVDVEFKKSQYEFTLNITGEGKVKVGDKTYAAGEQTFDVDAGETVSFEAIAGEHYEISSIKVDGQSQLVISDEFTVTADQAHTIEVKFAAEVYDVTINVGEGGTVNGETGTVTGEIAYGDSYTFTVEPEEGYEASIITNGQGSLKQGENGEYTLTGATGDVEISVKFERTSYNIDLTINGSGSVSYGSDTYTKSGTISVNPGQTATLNITADDGYKIAEVKVDGTSQGAANTVTFSNVNADHTVEVTFEPLKKYTVTVEKDKNSTGDGTVKSGNVTVESSDNFTVTEGGTFTFTAKPNDTKTTVKVTVDGDELKPTTTNGNTYQISDINADKKVIVTFAKETHNVYVTIVEKDGGSGVVQYNDGSGNQNISNPGKTLHVVDGDTITLSVNPNSGSESTVVIDGDKKGSDGTYTIKDVTGDVYITITFTKKEPVLTDVEICVNSQNKNYREGDSLFYQHFYTIDGKRVARVSRSVWLGNLSIKYIYDGNDDVEATPVTEHQFKKMLDDGTLKITYYEYPNKKVKADRFTDDDWWTVEIEYTYGGKTYTESVTVRAQDRDTKHYNDDFAWELYCDQNYDD